jgi:hypothetical protein
LSISARVIIERSRVIGAEMGLPDSIMLRFAQALLREVDHAQEVVAKTLADSDPPTYTAERQRSAFVLEAERGTLTPAAITGQANALGFDAKRAYIAIRARATDEIRLEDIMRALRVGGIHPPVEGCVTAIGEDLIGFVAARPANSTPGLVALGPSRPLDGLTDSLRVATRVLETAAAFGLTGVYDLISLGLRPAIAADDDLGRALIDRYVEPVLRDQFGAELVSSLLSYFEAGMHVGRAAKEMFVHPNTLRYRISRFETLAETNLRDQRTAIEVWWGLERYSIARLATDAAASRAA